MDVVKAIETEPLSKIKALIKSEEESFFSSWHGYKALNRALECGRKDVVKFLLADTRCMVNRSNKSSDLTSSNTPMHNAVKLGDVEIVDSLLKRGASISVINSDGDSPLHLAFLLRYVGIVDRMLSYVGKTLSYKNIKNKDGLAHLHIACTRKNKKVIVGYIKSRANVADVFCKDSPSSWAGYTAMHFAVEFKSAEAVAILSKVVNGNSVFNCEDANGMTPLQLAQAHLQSMTIAVDRLQDVEDHRKYLSNFHVACLKDDVDVVKKFIDNGANVNDRVLWSSKVCSGYLPLHCALDSPLDRSAKVNLLLQHGARVQCYYDEREMTPLHLAVYTNRTGAVDGPLDALYAALTDKTSNLMDENGLSIFHIAVAKSDFVTVKYHLDSGVDVNQAVLRNSRNFSSFTALHFAVHFGQLEMGKFLIEQGADVNAHLGKSNETPLVVAFDNRRFEFVELLLKYGARVDFVRQRHRQTLLHNVTDSYYSCNAEDQQKILKYTEMLVYMGVDVNALDYDNFTALHNLWWTQEKSATFVRLLLDLGADINIEAREVGLPFVAFPGIDCDTDECIIFLRHVQKLKAMGFYVCPQNEESYEIIAKTMDRRILKNMEKEASDEVEKLKMTKLTQHLSLYDFLTLDSKCAAAYIDNGVLKRIIEDIDFYEQFEVYGYLIKLQYRRALAC